MNNHINNVDELLAKEELALRYANQIFALTRSSIVWIEDLLNHAGTEAKDADRL